MLEPAESTLFFIGKEGDDYCKRAQEFTSLNFPGMKTLLGKRGEALPEDALAWRGDYLISYLSPWIIPQRLLDRAKIAAINFHPGPPEYPGIGCTNFAIYHEQKEFGITCHHMHAKVDTGGLIAVRRFPLLPTDTVLSLTQRCYANILVLYYEILTDIIQDKGIRRSSETWRCKPYRRIELDALCRITPEMPSDERRRRIRATTFPGMPGPYLDVDGKKIDLTE